MNNKSLSEIINPERQARIEQRRNELCKNFGADKFQASWVIALQEEIIRMESDMVTNPLLTN